MRKIPATFLFAACAPLCSYASSEVTTLALGVTAPAASLSANTSAADTASKTAASPSQNCTDGTGKPVKKSVAGKKAAHRMSASNVDAHALPASCPSLLAQMTPSFPPADAPSVPEAPAPAAAVVATPPAASSKSSTFGASPILPAVTPAVPATFADDAAARAALLKKEGDIDQKSLLKETLTAADKQYSLIKTGKYEVYYDFNYSYYGTEKINANFANGSLTLFDIENDSQHVLTNTVSVDYGLLDNLTVSGSFPIVSKYSENQTTKGTVNSIGDVSASVRWQPFGLQKDLPSLTFNGALRLPTGESPFKTIVNQDLSTGSGMFAFSGGVSVSKVVDPVALFASTNLSFSPPVKGLNQVRDARTLTSVNPGATFGFGAGIAYALSYDISTTMSFQESISQPTKLSFLDGSTVKTASQTTGMMTFGIGYRVSPLTTLNITLGIGLTAQSPNFSIGVNVPLHF